MKIVKVEYQVKPDFVETNKQSILKVMDVLKAKNITHPRHIFFVNKQQKKEKI